MRVLGEFSLKTLLDRIANELKQITRESHQSPKQEYNLRKPICEQQELQEHEKDISSIQDKPVSTE